MFFFSRGEQVALVLLLVVLAAAGGATWWVNAHPAPPEPFFVEAPGAPSGANVSVHVCGEVKHPGIYTVAAGARVCDAIKQAGGATANADLGAVNLAAEVVDGQQVYLPASTPSASAPAQPVAATAGTRGHRVEPAPGPPIAHKININRAGTEELDELPGIGPAYARRIIEYRERLKAGTGQGFTRVEQLMEIPGIGPKRFAEIKDRVTL